jgi:hypothetical protein
MHVAGRSLEQVVGSRCLSPTASSCGSAPGSPVSAAYSCTPHAALSQKQQQQRQHHRGRSTSPCRSTTSTAATQHKPARHAPTVKGASDCGDYTVFFGSPEKEAARFKQFQLRHGGASQQQPQHLLLSDPRRKATAAVTFVSAASAVAAAAVASSAPTAASIHHQFRAVIGGKGVPLTAAATAGTATESGSATTAGANSDKQQQQQQQQQQHRAELSTAADLQLHFGRDVMLRAGAGAGADSSALSWEAGSALGLDFATGLASVAQLLPVAGSEDSSRRVTFRLLDLEDIESYKVRYIVQHDVQFLITVGS